METIFLRMFCGKTIADLTTKVLSEYTQELVADNFVREPKARGSMFYFCMEVDFVH